MLQEQNTTKQEDETGDSKWGNLFIVGGVTVLLTVPLIVLDIVLSFIPGTGFTSGALAVTDWFKMFHDNAFLGLRNMGLFNIINSILSIPFFLALYGVFRKINRPIAMLALMTFAIGTAVYITKNPALSMLTLSGRYAAAVSEVEKSALVNTGQVLLGLAEDFTPGSFIGFILNEAAALIMAVLMYQGGRFSRLTAWLGFLGTGLMIIYTICATFVPGSFDVFMGIAIVSGLMLLAWYILSGLRLIQMGRMKDM
jgi:hypothetical protein